MGFRAKGKEKKGQKYYGERFKYQSRKNDSGRRRKYGLKEKGDRYVPLGRCDDKSRIEVMLSKLCMSQESHETFVKEVMVDISGLTQKGRITCYNDKVVREAVWTNVYNFD